MNDRIHLPKLRAALRRRYGATPELCCTQQADDTPRTQTIAWDLEDRRAAARIVPPEVWTREQNRYGSITLSDEWGNTWYVTERSDGTYHVVVHTPIIEAERKNTKTAKQRAARSAAAICKDLLRRAAS